MELRKKLIEFAQWREEAIIPDTIEELVDDFLQQTKAQDISSSAVLSVSVCPKCKSDDIKERSGYQVCFKCGHYL